jgi:transcriptional regulator with XRE-family HTH domain
MTLNPIMKIIMAKKLGVLIRDARLKSGKSLEECAKAMGISGEELNLMEYGERPPTLPEMELFAYYLEIPLEHFWGSETLTKQAGDISLDPAEINRVRQAAIGELITNGRSAVDITLDELSHKTGIAPNKLEAYEKGELPIPLPELEGVAQVLNSSIASFEDQQGPVGSWFAGQKYVYEFQKLPVDLQEFISRPINRPYLELAIRLSEMRVDKLRALGEGLLEITL